MKQGWQTGILFIGLLSIPVLAQGGIWIKPHYGVFKPRLGNVNDNLTNQLNSWRAETGEPIPSAGTFEGDPAYGIQIEYHTGGDTFVSINASFYDEELSARYDSEILPGSFLHYDRTVKFFDFLFNLHYYFNYNSWRRLNVYAGFGVGLVVANAESFTESTYTESSAGNPLVPVRTTGSFSGNSLSGDLAVGADIRFSPRILIFGETGIIYGNIGELDGTETTLELPTPVQTTTQSTFDFTGIYARAGIGLNF